MGSALSMLSSGPASLKFIVDVEDAPPPTNASMAELIMELEQAVENAQNYMPQAEPIRLLISNPSDPQIAMDAANALSDNVKMIAYWHDLGERVGHTMVTLTSRLSTSTLPQNTESAVSLLRILSLVWRFDQAKMGQPGIQNDFAGFRRVLGKVPPECTPLDEGSSGMISMWIADMSPITTKVVQSLQQSTPAVVGPVLAASANCCCGMASGPKSSMPEAYLQAMVCAMILYDKLNGSVFTAREIAVRKCALAIRNYGGPSTMQFQNSLKFSTYSYRDAPDSIQSILE